MKIDSGTTRMWYWVFTGSAYELFGLLWPVHQCSVICVPMPSSV